MGINFWDNMSEDNSRNILKSFKDKRIFTLDQKNFETISCKKFSFKKTKGKYVCFLDVDDYWTSDKLKNKSSI